MNEPLPSLPEGYTNTADFWTSEPILLLKGYAVYEHNNPERGWCFVKDECTLHPKGRVTIAIPAFGVTEEAKKPVSDYAAPATPSVLQEAEHLINGDRQQSYGDAYESFERIASFWHTYLKHKLKDTEHVTPKDVASMMILLKVSRSVTSSKRDNWVDAAAYAELGSQMEAQEQVPD